MTTTIELTRYLDKAGYRLRDDKFTEAAQRLRELDKPDCVWTHDGYGNSDTGCGGFFSNIMPSGVKFCTNCGGVVNREG